MSLHSLRKKLASGEAVVCGVLSGTSADGIDVALADCPGGWGKPPGEAPGFEGGPRGEGRGQPRLLAAETVPFPEDLGSRVRAALDGAAVGPREIAMLDTDLGLAFGAAARGLADRESLSLDLVGSVGQTIYHHDGRDARRHDGHGAATLQLGNADFLAEAARTFVVGDFRARDVAAGGEGAPIAALADATLFPALPRPAAILNLGGIANVTVLTSDENEMLSFDTGPAGALLDGLARLLLDLPLDRSGAVARRGQPSPELVIELGAHPFFSAPPPKSTGRDTFGSDWVAEVHRRGVELGLSAEELLATAVAHVAEHVAVGLERFGPRDLRGLWVAGGGVHNLALLERLEQRLSLPVASTAVVGVDPDFREALAFGVLAALAVLEHPVTRPRATGARAGRILGRLAFAPPPEEP